MHMTLLLVLECHEGLRHHVRIAMHWLLVHLACSAGAVGECSNEALQLVAARVRVGC
jgi:hypothetical protein